MPIKKKGNFDLVSSIIADTKLKLSSFLTEEEVDEVQISVDDGKLSFHAKDEILAKIEDFFGKPSGKLR
ncbi:MULTISPECIES: hypothetical protein [Vibrio]|uniref:Uncharacterized protein n=1 Tax=Vibrio alfacsensis TaxID=1074311 RepID=A0ABN5PGT1_9VIBR|nr:MULTISPECIES: hypothetical protein [Vibrio]AXY01239.1 hypothetical protein D1115_08595 [Vibrio alfacsensis]EKO3854994.1 hypothetical protein [Vibrio harveyi]MCG9550280.1 hypothetical protein [Vibrio harveyi]GEA22821.1 hypothetical protein VH1807_contig00028-0017 [Vibrio harveyi]